MSTGASSPQARIADAPVAMAAVPLAAARRSLLESGRRLFSEVPARIGEIDDRTGAGGRFAAMTAY